MSRRRKNKKKRFIVLSTIMVVAIFMSAGYSLLSQQINITGEANLYDSKNLLWYKLIDEYITDNGNGFYQNSYENGKYSYMGNDSNNYITLDNSLWRIVSIESDHTIKVVKWDDSIIKEFDETNNRTIESTYCNNLSNGCNSWSSQIELTNKDITGTVTNNSSLLTYLNTTFYNSLSDDLKSKIALHNFNVGKISITSTLSEALIEEQSHIWEGYVGLLSLTDILTASNISNINIGKSYENNYLLNYATNKILWTINPYENDSSKVWTINYDKTQVGKNANLSSEEIDNTTYNFIALPTVYLNSLVKYDSGNGSIDNPFKLK